MKGLLSILLLTASLSLSAATLDGISFADKINVAGVDLILNGIGIRKATFLNIKVYYGALYLEAKSKEPSSFLTSTSPKQVIMHFVREVDAKKLKEAFTEGMETANKNAENFKIQLEKFNSQVEDVVKGDQFIITFLNDGVLLNAKGKPHEKIIGADFSKALLNIWFTNPRDKELKSGLLGL
jgi:hypothetical protein